MRSAGLSARRAADALHKWVALDTTVQPKATTIPTDAKLVRVATKGLKRLAREHGVRLRQSYVLVFRRDRICRRARLLSKS